MYVRKTVAREGSGSGRAYIFCILGQLARYLKTNVTVSSYSEVNI